MVAHKNILFILLTFLFADCPIGYQEYYDSSYWGYSCYYDDDIEFLNALMDNNCADYDENNEYTTIECVSGLDGDSNNDGIVQPIDFCNQWWEYNLDSDGLRLISLNCNHNQGLAGDGLIGTIPENIGNLSELEELIFENNFLEGSIPSSIGNLTNLKTLNFRNNNLSETIPSSIGNLVHLEYLNLMYNDFSGVIPASIGNLINLEELLLGSNYLNGPIPSGIWDLTSLTELGLWGNNLTGSISNNIENLINLRYLYLGQNELTGTIPEGINNLIDLKSLGLEDNQLNGNIPEEISTLVNLESLYLYNNQLNGSIPSNIGSLTSATEIILSNNQLTGWIPLTLELIPDLESLFLSDNQLTGIIPQFLTYLNTYSVYNNLFCPPYPSSVVLGFQDVSTCGEYIHGNLNNDAEIDIFDIIIGVYLIVNNIELTNYQYWALDLDGDGSHDVNDIIYLSQLIMYHM